MAFLFISGISIWSPQANNRFQIISAPVPPIICWKLAFELKLSSVWEKHPAPFWEVSVQWVYPTLNFDIRFMSHHEWAKQHVGETQFVFFGGKFEKKKFVIVSFTNAKSVTQSNFAQVIKTNFWLCINYESLIWQFLSAFFRYFAYYGLFIISEQEFFNLSLHFCTFPLEDEN